MIELNKNKRVKEIQNEFLSETGLFLRIYKGNKTADEDLTLKDLNIKESIIEFSTKMKISTIEDKFKEANLKVKIASSDNSKLCNKEYTLAKAKTKYSEIKPIKTDSEFKEIKEWLNSLDIENREDILEAFDEASDSDDYVSLAQDIMWTEEDKSKEYAKILLNKAYTLAKESYEYRNIADTLIDEELLNDREWAKKLYREADVKAESFRECLNLGESIAEYLKDKNWTRELFKRAYERKDDFEDSVSLAESIAREEYLNDKNWAREVYKEALDLANNFNEYLDIANSIFDEDFLNDREWARGIFQKCESLANSVDEYTDLISSVNYEYALNDREWGERLLNETLEKCESLEDYDRLLSVSDENIDIAQKIVTLAIPLIEDDEQKEEWADNIENILDDESWAEDVRESTLQELKSDNKFLTKSLAKQNVKNIQKRAIYFTLALMKWLRLERELENIVNYRIPRDFIADMSKLDFYKDFEPLNNEAISYANEAKEENSFEEFLRGMWEENPSKELAEETSQCLFLYKYMINEFEPKEIAKFYSEKIDYVINKFFEGEKEELFDPDFIEAKVNELYELVLKKSESYRNWMSEDEENKNLDEDEIELKELHNLFESLYLMEKNGTIHEDMVNDIYSHSFKYIYKELGGKEACENYCDGYPIEDFGESELIEEMYKEAEDKSEIVEAIKIIMNTCIHSSKYMDYYEAIEKSGLPTKSVDSIDDVLEVVREDGSQLENFEEYHGDREVVLEAVKNYRGWASPFEYATDELKSDRDFVLEVVEVAGQALEYASEELQDDKEVVLKAIKQSASAYEFISDRLRDDRDVALEAVKSSGFNIREISEKFKNDREIALQAVVSEPDSIESLNKELQNDKEIALEAVAGEERNIEYVSEKLRSDRDILIVMAKSAKAYHDDFAEFEENWQEFSEYVDRDEFKEIWENLDNHEKKQYRGIWNSLKDKLFVDENVWKMIEKELSFYYSSRIINARNKLIQQFLGRSSETDSYRLMKEIEKNKYLYLLIIAILAKGKGGYKNFLNELHEKDKSENFKEIVEFIDNNREELFSVINLEEI